MSVFGVKQFVWSICAGLALVCFTANASTLRVVVAGDGRAASEPRPGDKDGVNEPINRELAEAVLREKAQALLWTGDLVNVPDHSAETFEKRLLFWRKIYEPLYDQGVAVLPARGNHEVMCPGADRIWDKVFSGRYALPLNGPATETNLSFYYTNGPALFVGVDQYETVKESVDVAWLGQVLRERKGQFVFVYGHEPAFMDGHHADTLDAHPKERDAMWEALIGAGARVYFCGHDHFYDHMKVTRAKGEPGPEMHQFTAGTAGAPFYEGKGYAGNNTYWKLTQIKHIDHTYGYLLLEITDSTATVTFKGRTGANQYEAMDTFSYSVGQR